METSKLVVSGSLSSLPYCEAEVVTASRMCKKDHTHIVKNFMELDPWRDGRAPYYMPVKNVSDLQFLTTYLRERCIEFTVTLKLGRTRSAVESAA